MSNFREFLEKTQYLMNSLYLPPLHLHNIKLLILTIPPSRWNPWIPHHFFHWERSLFPVGSSAIWPNRIVQLRGGRAVACSGGRGCELTLLLIFPFTLSYYFILLFWKRCEGDAERDAKEVRALLKGCEKGCKGGASIFKEVGKNLARFARVKS